MKVRRLPNETETFHLLYKIQHCIEEHLVSVHTLRNYEMFIQTTMGDNNFEMSSVKKAFRYILSVNKKNVLSPIYMID